MTPEEKAIKLVAAFSADGDIPQIFAEGSAITCCDEVIAEIEDLQQNCLMEFPMALEYWKSVKEEIEKM